MSKNPEVLRIGELLALRWQDIDLEAGVLRVRRTLYEGHFDEPKTSNRTVPLGPGGNCHSYQPQARSRR
jgi:integrase